MITINDKTIEHLIGEILKRTKYSNPLEYLEARIKSDHSKLIRNKKLD